MEVKFKRPYSPFLAALSTAFFGIQSPKQLALGPETLAKKVVGTGPFVIDAFVPHQGITYHRNPDYKWPPAGAGHTGPALLERLEYKVLVEDSVRLGALTSGQIDAIASVPPVSVKQVEADSRLTIVRRQAPGGNYNYYPNTAKGVFADPKVRQAFRDGIDFGTVVTKLYFGAFEPAKGPISPVTAGADPAVQRTYDVAKANQLLDEAGWTGRDADGFRTKNFERLTVHWPFQKATAREQRATLSEQVQAEAKKLGFEVVFDDVTPTDFPPKAMAGDYDLIDFSWQRAEGDTLRTLFGISNIPSEKLWGQNLARYDNAEVDAWLEEALATTDLAERAALYAKVQQQVTADAAVFPVYSFTYLLGASKSVRDVKWEPQGPRPSTTPGCRRHDPPRADPARRLGAGAVGGGDRLVHRSAPDPRQRRRRADRQFDRHAGGAGADHRRLRARPAAAASSTSPIWAGCCAATSGSPTSSTSRWSPRSARSSGRRCSSRGRPCWSP